MTVLISPVFNEESFSDNLGNPLSGGKIFQYEAGSSSVFKDTFTSEGGTVANANPIVLDSSGRLTAAIWLTQGEAYNLVLTQADGTTVLKGFDNITGAGSSSGGGGGTTSAIWTPVATPVYLTTTSFAVAGNETVNLAVGNRVRLTLNTGFVYGTVSVSTFSSPNTSCTVIIDGGATLNSSLSVAEWSALVKNGRTVEAGAVTYNAALTPAANTVASQLQTLATVDATTNTRIDALRKVWTASGTNTYSISPSPAVSSLSNDAVFTVFFTNASSSVTSLNVNGLGAVPLKQYNSAGTVIDAVITAGRMSDVAYTGSVFILLDPLPPTSSVIPHAFLVYGANSTFTVPAGVTSIKVTCAGGGGGGGGTYSVYGGGDSGTSTTYYGGGGGGGAKAISVISTTPGTVYSIGVGAGGATTESAGNTGGSSSFGITLVIATGGAGGGAPGPGAAGGAGGNAGSVGTFISPGGSGGAGSTREGGSSGVGPEPYYGSGGVGGGTNGAQGYVTVEY
jgi:hypothetical protein